MQLQIIERYAIDQASTLLALRAFSQKGSQQRKQGVFSIEALQGYATMGEMHAGLTRYFAFYNGERPHQGLDYRTPDVVYESGEGGGAMIVNKYSSVPEQTPPELVLGLHSGSAGEHSTPPQTPPCWELNAMTSTLKDGVDTIMKYRAAPIRRVRVQDTSLNSGKNCLDGWSHFTQLAKWRSR